MNDASRATRALCPQCLRTLPAVIERAGDVYRLVRSCPEHGFCQEVIWRGAPDLDEWQRPPAAPARLLCQTATARGCPRDCGRCPEHEQKACTVLFEITDRCNLRCPVCFAASGDAPRRPLPRLAELVERLGWIREQAGPVVLQLSGGEPTLFPKLPELVHQAVALFPAVQLNTNGLELARDSGLASRLAAAGLSWVFLQFDGTRDAVYTALRGRPLLKEKVAAIDACRAAGLGVVLVPTLARGVNDQDLGDLLRFALERAPGVRGLHLQPMTMAGRNALDRSRRLTLPEVLRLLCEQSNGLVRPEHAAPPGCEHARCSFHCRYRLTAPGTLTPLREPTPCCNGGPAPEPEQAVPSAHNACGRIAPRPVSAHEKQPGNAAGRCAPAEDRPFGFAPGATRAAEADRAIEVILRSWRMPEKNSVNPAPPGDAFDAFLAAARSHTFSITCMAFQDAWTTDLERLHACCVHVYVPPDRLVPFCACNLTDAAGRPLYRPGSGQ